MRGRDVAGIGSIVDGMNVGSPAWATHVRVTDVDTAVDAVTAAGGTIHNDPFDVPPVGRSAVIIDPTGAMVCLWQAQAREGAQLVNEPGGLGDVHAAHP